MIKPKFHLCSCGHCSHPEWSCIKDGSFKAAEFPAHVGVIDHPHHGLILFDTGYADHIAPPSASWPQKLYSRVLPFEIPSGQELPAQLARLGFGISDVKWIIISHFHPDHIAGLKDFPSARIICSRVAWNMLHRRRGWSALRQAFLPELLPADMLSRTRWIEDAAISHISDSLPGFLEGRDLFGCGSLIAVALPGHAVGQYGLYIPECGGNGPIFLAADACWRSRSYRHYILPPAMTMALMHDPETYRSTLLKLHQLSLVRDDIAIIPSHCNEASKLLKNEAS